ncbi:stage III sporulation protein AE [Clostridium botulinum]|uniref:Stage III sporulation protein AE n=1 Tax=Clostridium botulinum C/D str. DC5 TaxID=1443128 RepID=A0A0A0IKC3_CLOBO|nr:stage III sporulation protein AE [Clostridium botulinum]KEI07104.1 stage III sporulation protein AE [Clostridium botulinum C/D str. BKT75002]KEI12181.1 stage III sporulation protein AE [Clostridium botulinum C/D str. BKT2873]KGM96866.1 stage III sporulation protein AE [Clostridium botulinum D str. CCUG 7971]KGN01920.1 stage III sporulation protein AE [Clostridium botulinum C/D str. DC5]KOC48557.1 stage III sporulation protein AE [Clostridium botulinum]
MKKLLFVIIMFLMIPLNVQAQTLTNKGTTDLNKEQNMQVESLYDYMSNIKTKYEMLNDVDIKTYVKDYMKNGKGDVSKSKFIKALAMYSFREVIACGKLMAMIVVICIICALINNLENAFSNGNLSNIAYFACYALLIIIITKTFYIGITAAKDVLKQMTDFMAALMPVLLMLLASVGGFTQAATMDPIIIGVTNISARLFMDLIIPIISISFVIQFCNNISDDHKIDKLSKLLNKSVLWIQGIVMTIFIGTITIRGMTTSTLDAVTEKTAKFAIDNFIPVVGKSLSDAISTVASYSLLLKNALSSIGLIILITIIIFPIIKLFAMGFIYKLTGALIEPISNGKLVKCIESAGDSIILITSCVISVSVMFFIIICIIASAGKSIIGM